MKCKRGSSEDVGHIDGNTLIMYIRTTNINTIVTMLLSY